MEMVGGAPEQGLPGERDKHALDTSVPVLKMGRTTHVLLCVGGQQEYLENVLHKIAGGSIVFPAAAGAEPKVFFGRCRIATKNEKEVGTTKRTFIGPHKA